MIVAIVVLGLAVGSQAQICCVPAQWEGMEGTVLGVSRADLPGPMAVTGSIGVAYDATNKRVAAYMYMETEGYNTSVGVILDYAQGVQYTASGSNCTRTRLGSFVPSCIPSDAKLIRTGYFGVGDNKMLTNTFKYMRGNLDVEATVTANTCVPVGESIAGETGGEYVVQSIGFSGITAGIKNMDSFTPPSNCMNSPIVQTNMNPMHSRILRRFSSLLP